MAEGKRWKFPGRTGWLISAAVLLALTIALMFAEKVFASSGAREALGRLSNAFFVAGLLYAGAGGLTFVAAMGGFDSFTYIFKNFALHSLIPTRQPKKYKSFYDYRTEKDEKGRHWLPHLLILGGGMIVVSVILLAVGYAFG